MATKKHKRRKRDTRTEEQKAQSARDLAQAQAKPAEKKSGALSRSKDDSSDKNKVAKANSNKKPSIFKRFVNWCKEVRGEMQRVVWPTRSELVNASFIVIGALVFFGVFIAIIDNVILLPLTGIASLGVNIHG